MILYLDTRGPENEVALYDGTKPVRGQTIPQKQLSEWLAVVVEKLLANSGHKMGDVTGIVARRGPGSFTGLRIGLSYANGLAFGLDIPLVGIDESDDIEQVLSNPLKKQTLPILPIYSSDPHVTKRRDA